MNELANRPMKLMAGGGRPQLIAGVSPTGEAMVAKVGLKFIENALADPCPISALEKLAWAWGLRADSTRHSFGLSEPEYHVQLCRIYLGEVGNGGHLQYFLNRGLKYLDDTLHALGEVGLHEHRTILSAAAQVLGGRIRELNAVEAHDYIERLGLVKSWALGRLDKRCWHCSNDTDAVLVAYLVAHRGEWTNEIAGQR